jgi:hypothetical protein
MTRCIGEPVSWFKLERYGLGELSERDAVQVAQHLAECPVCGACYAQIEAQAQGDSEARPPLPAAAARATRSEAPRSRPTRARSKNRHRNRNLAVAGTLLSAALGAWLALGPDMEPPLSERRGSGVTDVKGGELALELVRVASDGRMREPGHFAPGDRFKVLFSCPPARTGALRLRVFQAGHVFEPLPPYQLENCGNRRSLPGAFSLDGSDRVSVCVILAGDPAQVEQAREPGQLPKDSVCTRVLPREPAE